MLYEIEVAAAKKALFAPNRGTLRNRGCALLLSGLNERVDNHDALMTAIAGELAEHAVRATWLMPGEEEMEDGKVSLVKLSKSIDDAAEDARRRFGAEPLIVARGAIGNLLLGMVRLRRLLINPTNFGDVPCPSEGFHVGVSHEEMKAYLREHGARAIISPDMARLQQQYVIGGERLEELYTGYATRPELAQTLKLLALFPQRIAGQLCMSVIPDVSHYADLSHSLETAANFAQLIGVIANGMLYDAGLGNRRRKYSGRQRRLSGGHLA